MSQILPEAAPMMEVPSLICYRHSPPDHDFEDSISHMDDFADCSQNQSANSSSLALNCSFNQLGASSNSGLTTPPRQQPQQQQQQQPLATPPFGRPNQNVRVQVGGEDFSFPQNTFQKFLALPWRCDIDGVFHLNGNTSPAVFEVLLDYTLFGTLPAYDTLCDEEFREFEVMALAMGFHDLVEHFDRKDSYLVKELRQGGRSRKVGAGGDPMLLNPASRSPTSVAAATKCVQFLGALCGGGGTSAVAATTPTTLSNDLNAKRFKLTHGEWVSSQNVS